MVEVQSSETETCRIQVRPNRSLSRRGLCLTVGLVSSGALLASGFFALQGLWVPLPLAGAELLAFTACMIYVLRRSDQFELIDVGPDRVAVTAGGSGSSTVTDFQRYWLRVELKPGRYASDPRRLTLSSHGREVEVGRFLNENERTTLFGELRRLVRNR
ncbi:MAG: DUF2244 domain-containing protein [Xanthomonadales bacterium]|nr:DUF2244 domain-containing protein [Xanthomonadales bacterium]